MRQIGILPSGHDPRIFGDYLLSLGVSSRAVERADGWVVWVHNEDQVASARSELEAYLLNPSDPRYASAESQASEIRRQEAAAERDYRKRVRDMKGRYDSLNVRGRPVTILLIAICVPLFLATQISPHMYVWVWNTFGFFPLDALMRPDATNAGLQAIHDGQIWRLLTPIFLHVNLMHLGFNMWATWIEGTLIEYCKGTRTLVVLTLLAGVTSNIGQYLWTINFDHQLIPWGGISGVGYALFGYIWMKSEFDRESGIRLHPSAVRTMIFWLLLGLTGFLRMANGAHISGFIVGILFGLAGF